MIISLIGYMGSGKSHISKVLSAKLQYKLVDLDREITLKAKSSIAEIFETKGEIYFRKLEREVLENVLGDNENYILSLGGGTPAYYNNMELINEKTESIFLQASVNQLAQRLLKQKSKRPLIAKIKNEDLPEFIAKHLFERNSFYSKANYTINTDGKNPEEIANEIIEKVFRN